MLLAALLRIGFFVGLVSGDPQDDGIYYGNALALYHDGLTYLDRYRNLPSDFLANPIDQFHFRPMVTYPIALSFAVFGPGEVSAALWGFLCSILTVLVVYRLGSRIHDRSVGLLAALLCAFYPLEVINGTRILSDVQVGLFSALSLLLLMEGGIRRNCVFFVLAGVAAAGAYLANARGLVLLLVLVCCGAVQTLLRKTTWLAPVAIMAGFCLVFSAEAVIYFLKTGDPFLSYHIQSGAASFKYLHEPVASVDWGWLRVSYTNGEPWELLRSMMLLIPRPTRQFGLFFFLFFAAAIFSLVKRRNLLLLAVAFGLALYLEFGPVRLSFNATDRELHYMMVFKQERFLLTLTAPLVVLAADLLRAVQRTSKVGMTILVVVLFATSMSAIAHTRDFYRAGLHDLRSIADEVRSNPDRIFFGDFWAVEHLKIFSRYQAQNFRVLHPQTSPHEVKGACVMLGGSRGVELVPEYVASTLPPFARNILDSGEAPPGWELVREFRGSSNPERRRDFRVYCVA